MTLDERRLLESSPDSLHEARLERDREERYNGFLKATQKAIAQGDVDEPAQPRVNPHEL